MKYFLSITFFLLTSAVFVGLSCSPLMEEGGFVDAQATVSSEVDNEQSAPPAQDENNDSSTDTTVSSPVGPEDVEEVPEEGEPPPTRIF